MGIDPLENRVAELRRQLTWAERERALYLGAPLVVFPALALLPLVAFWVVVPRFAHARPLGLALLPLLLALIAFGMARLARCLHHEFDIISFLACGSLAVFFVIVLYTGVYLAAFLFLP